MTAAVELEPLVRRLTADNPSPFTFRGTNSYVVGPRGGAVAVIDPGPMSAAHLQALLAATAGETVAAIVVSHTHRDHSPLSRALAARTGAPIVGCAPLALRGGAEAGFDADYLPDRVLAEGERVAGEGWTLEAVATPGHTSNHLAFHLPETNALFTADHVMGWSTTVVSPPDGDMTDYMASLEKLIARDDRVYYPGHGDEISDRPQRLARGQLGHRKQREGQILRALDGGAERSIPEMVAEMYKGLDPRLAPAAGRSVLAHLIDLDRRGLAAGEGERWRRAG